MSPKTKKIITVLVIVAIIAIGLYFVFRKPKAAITTGAGSVTSAGTDPNAIDATIVFPLKSGSTGKGVKQVQAYLNSKYNAGLTVDGIWGPKTNAAANTYLNRDNVSSDVYVKWNLSSF